MEWLLYKPNLNCNSCLAKYYEHKITPLCRTSKGCPIQELAQSKEITEKCKAYSRARSLMQYEHLRELGIEELKKHGLTDASLLIDLEKRVVKYQKSVKTREDSIKEAENLAKKISKGK